ncbi:transposase [Microbispora sp. NPDC049125]|uniref:transposase n=1 Tax=Microbispora sp. NPDC049125 TaxID=3154929 RepID=UPI003464F7CD
MPPLVVANAAYGDNARLRAALAERGLHYVVQVKGAVTAHHATDEPDPSPTRAAVAFKDPSAAGPAWDVLGRVAVAVRPDPF